MRLGLLLVLGLALAGCGLRTGGRRLPDGGFIGTAEGCNRLHGDGNLVLDPAEAPFVNVNALVFDSDGFLYVANRSASASYISVFGPSPNNDFQKVIGRGALRDLLDIVRVPEDGSFWALQGNGAAMSGHEPEVMHLGSDGAVLSRFPVSVDEPGGITRGPDGTLYVSFSRIGRFDEAGTLMGTFGAKPPYVPYYQGMAF
ncbi:MAG: hypothetical protein JNK82_08580, partial [Myxococcaceae bacterium]|nr:hypothetical protein [Myxococcaceae bacterium]